MSDSPNTPSFEGEAAPRADGWIEWKGGKCPVLDGTAGFVRFRNGSEYQAQNIADFSWRHCGGDDDIAAYRIATSPTPEQAEALKPCPFCGSEPEWNLGKKGDGSEWRYIACSNCEAIGPHAHTRSIQVADWNRRATSPTPSSPDAGVVERIAREVWRSQHGPDFAELDTEEAWASEVSSYRKLTALYPSYANGRSSITDAFRTAEHIVASGVIAALTSPSAQSPGVVGLEEAWRDLIEKDDRTSPEDYPEMALITRDELAGYMACALAHPLLQKGDGVGEARPVAWQVQDARGVWQRGLMLKAEAEFALADPHHDVVAIRPLFARTVSAEGAEFRPNKFMGATGIRQVADWARSRRGAYVAPDNEESITGCNLGEWCGS
ncbi:MAG: hypothetical protein DI629_12345 [Mesorhizobium amorphae]|nr:MAG: hypothetical protein DI629_12345 [Mesorhizobium amorphae]